MFKKYVNVLMVIILIVLLSGCDLYDPGARESITMSNNQKVDYIDGKDPVDENVDNTDVANADGARGTDSDVNTDSEADSDVDTNSNTDADADGSDETDTEAEDNAEVETDSSEEIESEDKTETNEESTGGNSDITEEERAKANELAKELNSDGFVMYQNGEYEDALNKFRESMNTDDEYFYGHFNYACTLGVLMKQDYEYWYESKDEIIEVLKECLAIDPSSKSKIMSDTDLDPVKKELKYLTQVAGYDLSTSDGVRNVLKKANWYVQGSGVISVIGEVTFDGNNVVFSYMNLEKFNEGTIGDPIIAIGKYSLNGNVITFTMNEPTLKRRTLSDIYNNYDVFDDRVEFSGTLSSDGILTIDGFEYQFYTWYDEFSA